MELIGTGILLAIGFYLAPVILGLVFGAVVAIVAGVTSIFK